MVKLILVLTITAFLSCACNNIADETQILHTQDTVDSIQEIAQSANIEKGEETMEEPLLTKEEFLQKVVEYKMSLGVTVADFQDIDVNDFIEQLNITESSFMWFIEGGLIFKTFFKRYIASLETRKIYAYQAQSMKVVESTDSEYAKFKNNYFSKLINEPVYKNDLELKLERYEMQGSEKKFEFLLGRTQYIYQYKDWQILDNPCLVTIPLGPEGMQYSTRLYLSKNSKYFVLFIGGPYEVEIVKAFCEIDD